MNQAHRHTLMVMLSAFMGLASHYETTQEVHTKFWQALETANQELQAHDRTHRAQQ